jgi:hypothetical protein
MDAGVDGMFIAGKKDNNTLQSDKYAQFPAFYVGADYTIEDVASFGAAFAGQPVGERYDPDDGKFPWMANIHAKLLMVSPLTIGINVSFYGAPEAAPELFSINEGPVGKGAFKNFSATPPAKSPVIGGAKAMVLEALLDVGIGLGICNVGVTGGMVMNVASEDDLGGGMAMKLGASATFPVGETGFSITPGVMYTNYLKTNNGTEKVDGKLSMIDFGLSFGYSF